MIILVNQSSSNTNIFSKKGYLVLIAFPNRETEDACFRDSLRDSLAGAGFLYIADQISLTC